ncbi:MAG TPA: FliH/SctL family protein [Pyrinomonadaceae bacterium]|jgi:type III secretion protein L
MSAGNVIKNPTLKERAKSPNGVMKRAVVDARSEARRILSEAEHAATEIRARAEQTAAELREAAYQEGLEAALLELNEHLLEARERRDTALKEVEQDVLRLSVKLAEKIVGRELEQNEATLADIVATAMRHVRQHETLVVRVNPSDLPNVLAHRERLDPTGRARFLDVVADPRVAQGGCIIESESGTINAQLETQLRVLERALLARAEGTSGQ